MKTPNRSSKEKIIISVSVQLRLVWPIGLSPVYCTYSLLLLLVLHTYVAYIRLSIVHYYTHQIYRLFSLSCTLYCQHGIRAIPLTFWFLWTSLAFFRYPYLHPIVTVRSESLPSRLQSLQLLDLIVLLIQLPKQRH